MKFELNEYHRQLTDEELIQDIIETAHRLCTDYMSIATYKREGKYSQTAIQGHFGTWKHALEIAGLRTERTKQEIKLISNEQYFEDLNRVAELIKKETVPYDEYKKYGKYSAEHIINRFGKWNIALDMAGLKNTGFCKDKITEQQCFDEIERLWRLLGRQPTTTDIIKGNLSIYSVDTFKRRFGGWRKALEAFVQYINNEDDYENVIEQDTSNIEEDISDVVEQKEAIYKHRTSRNITAKMRFKVLQRDYFKCCACGASPAKNPETVLHVDHIIPWAKGGETEYDNLQTLCSNCNLGKSDMM